MKDQAPLATAIRVPINQVQIPGAAILPAIRTLSNANTVAHPAPNAVGANQRDWI